MRAKGNLREIRGWQWSVDKVSGYMFYIYVPSKAQVVGVTNSPYMQVVRNYTACKDNEGELQKYKITRKDNLASGVERSLASCSCSLGSKKIKYIIQNFSSLK